MCRINHSLFAAVALFVTGAAVSVATAADPEGQRPSAAAPVMNADGLYEMLVDMAYEPTRESVVEGASRFGVQIQKNRRDYDVIVALSRDGKLVTLSTSLEPQTNHGDATSAVYLALLELNSQMGSAAFALDGQGGLRLSRAYETRSMNPAKLRKALDAFGASIASTEAKWKAENFPKTSVKADPAQVQIQTPAEHLRQNPFASKSR
jgi:hypothetical protein